MKYCSSCGHELGVGRFCTNCGQPIDRAGAHAATAGAPAGPDQPAPDRPAPGQPAPRPPVDETLSATGERRAARRDAALTPGPPRTPPSADDTPAPPRFPLYADEVGPEVWDRTATDLPPVSDDLEGGPMHASSRVDGPAGAVDESGGLLARFAPASSTTRTPEEAYAALHAAAGDASYPDDPDGADRRSGHRRWPWLVVLLVVVIAAAVLVWLGTRDSSDDDGDASDPSGSATPASLTSEVQVKTPGNAPPSQETDGDKATFVGANMLDGEPTTAWRVAGNARGKEIVFTFPEKVTISQVGLINGYAKSGVGAGGRRFDWYHGNRTISKVAWVFDDNTLLQQDLVRNRRMQTLAVDAITTKTLTLRLLDVSAPGTGRARRDFTAISDVTLTGTPAS